MLILKLFGVQEVQYPLKELECPEKLSIRMSNHHFKTNILEILKSRAYYLFLLFISYCGINFQAFHWLTDRRMDGPTDRTNETNK